MAAAVGASVRKLPSGRYQARYRVEGRWKTAPATLRTKGEADAFLAATRADLERGTWTTQRLDKSSSRSTASAG
jgi:hypothetical protein